MKAGRDFRIQALLLAAMAAALASCGKARDSKSADPVAQAYVLMDQGENARAIQVLEKATAEKPDNSEARALLASAYAGQAGIDIFKVYDGFKDLLFNKPLRETLLKTGGSAAPETKPAAAPSSASASAKDDRESVSERLIAAIDKYLGTVKEVVSFLQRFPTVKQADWSLLDRSLDLLDKIQPGSGKTDKDVVVYRLLIRVVYLKSFFIERVLRNQDFGRREWACSLTQETVDETMNWVLLHAERMLADYNLAFPGKSFGLTGVDQIMREVRASLSNVDDNAPAGARTGELTLESRIRTVFQCDSN